MAAALQNSSNAFTEAWPPLNGRLPAPQLALPYWVWENGPGLDAPGMPCGIGSVVLVGKLSTTPYLWSAQIVRKHHSRSNPF